MPKLKNACDQCRVDLWKRENLGELSIFQVLFRKQDFTFTIHHISLLISQVASSINQMSTQILISDATSDLSGLSLDNFILCGHPERSHTIRNLELSASVRVQLR